jgi:NTE family protein
VYSTSNDDLARDHERTVILLPMIRGDGAFTPRPGTLAIVADAESTAAFGPNALDPASRAPASDAGLRQAEGMAQAVAHYWNEGLT